MAKHRQCPHCKGRQGFKITYQVKGFGHEVRTFTGKVMDADRFVVDDSDDYAECIECGGHIAIDKVETDT